MAKEFWEAHILNLPSELESKLTPLLFDQGALGTTQNLNFAQPSLVYEATVVESETIHLIVYFDIQKKEMVAPWLQSWIWRMAPEAEVHWLMQKNQDWLAVWKKHFKPFRIGLWNFVPLWLYKKSKHKRSVSILLEPGMAFGTGHHATTKSAIVLLGDLNKKGMLKRKTVLDVGAGSGILSVVGEKCGAKSVLAVDNDPHSWRESKKTFRINKTKKCKTTKKQLEAIKATFDIVVANIIDGVLLQLKEDLVRVSKPGGWILLSGILKSRHEEFENEFISQTNLKVVKRLYDDEWVSLLVQNT